jgi:WD40 repeat protein
VALIPGPHQSDSDAFNTAAVAFSPDGDLFVSYEGQRVRIFNPASGEQIGELPTASFQGAASPNHLAFTKDGQTLVGTTEHGQMAAWDVPSHALRWSSSDAGCLSIAIGPRSEGPLYCAGPADRVVPIDLASGQPSAPGFHTQQGAVLGLALTPDGRRLLFTSESRPLLGVWRLDGGGPIQRTIAAGAEPRAYRADGEVLLVHERLGEHEALWDPTTGTLVNPLDGVTDSLYFVGSDRLVAIWRDQAGVYDYRANEMVLFEGPDPVNAAPDLAGHRQLVWYGDGRHRFFDLITGQEVGPVLPLNRFTRAATFTADGRHLALSDLVDGVTIFEATTGEKVAGPEGGLAFTAITPEGLLIASTATGDLSFRDAATLEPRGPSLPAGSGLTNARLGLSADGSLLVASPSPSTPGQTRLFDVAGRTPLGGGIETVGSAALSPDGRELAVATTDGVALWDLNSAHWVEAACRIASRNMTRDEWSTYIGDLAPYRQTCPTRA